MVSQTIQELAQAILLKFQEIADGGDITGDATTENIASMDF